MLHIARTLSLLLCVVVLAAACGSEEGGDTTTTAIAGGDTTTSTTAAGTTTAADGATTTTTAGGETTTTVAGGETTTTVTGETTTTVAGTDTTVAETTTTTVGGETTSTTLGTTETTITGDFVLVTDPKGFSFSYPTTWTMELDDFGDYSITAPTGGASTTDFLILLEDSDVSPVEMGQDVAAQLAAFLPDFELISQGEETIAGLPGYVIEYTAAGLVSGTDRYLDGFVSANGSLFNLVFVGPTADYDTWLTDAISIWESFDFSS